MENSFGIVILAAGASVRLGNPKQLLEYEGKSLMQHVIDAALDSNAKPVIVVVGANADLVARVIDQTKVHVATNAEWEEGMASSVRVGLKTLQKVSPSAEGVILMVCDQPFVTAGLVKDLIDTHIQDCKPIVTSNYGHVTGPPALFHKSFFGELMKLKGDAGARELIRQHADKVATVLFPQGKVDIDTLADYEALKTT